MQSGVQSGVEDAKSSNSKSKPTAKALRSRTKSESDVNCVPAEGKKLLVVLDGRNGVNGVDQQATQQQERHQQRHHYSMVTGPSRLSLRLPDEVGTDDMQDMLAAKLMRNRSCTLLLWVCPRFGSSPDHAYEMDIVRQLAVATPSAGTNQNSHFTNQAQCFRLTLR